MTQTLYRNFFASWFGKAKRIVISDDAILLIDSNHNAKELLINSLVDFPYLEQTVFGDSLIIKAKSKVDEKNTIEVSKIWGISRESVEVFNHDLKDKLYRLIAKNISYHADMFHKEALSQYLRDSSVAVLDEAITPLIFCYKESKQRWQAVLSEHLLAKIDVITRMPAIKEVQSYRQYYENTALKSQSTFFEGIESNPLTKEQRLAVIRNNDKNLVLAAAGTGKTSVMVAKALNLINHDNVPADKVLILAYNNAAAKELQQRLSLRKKAFGLSCQSPQVMTFHALGLNVLTKVKANTKISPFASDSALVEAWLSAWLQDYIKQCPQRLTQFINLAYQGSNKLSQQNEIETNYQYFMREHGIDDLAENTDDMMAALHSSGLFLQSVKKYVKYLQAIRGEQLTSAQVKICLDNANISLGEQYGKLLDDIVQAYKLQLSNQSAIDFDDMILNATAHVEKENFKPLWTDILVDEFQDISTARMKLLNEIISKGPKPRLTAVGDDWQSIYRFSGGNLALITQFEKFSGKHSITTLQKTFRYNNSIAETAGQFVMQNPEQYKKQIQAHDKVDKSQVYLLHSAKNATTARIKQIVNKIRLEDTSGSIAILARYRYLLDDAKTQINSAKNVNFWTFHSAKGLEADYCVIVGLFSGKTGFPSNGKEDPVLEALLPQLDDFKHAEERRLFYVAITRAKKKAYLLADANSPSAFIEELLSPNYQLNILSNEFKHNLKDEMADKTCVKCGRAMKKRKSKQGEFWGCSGFAHSTMPCNQTENI